MTMWATSHMVVIKQYCNVLWVCDNSIQLTGWTCRDRVWGIDQMSLQHACKLIKCGPRSEGRKTTEPMEYACWSVPFSITVWQHQVHYKQKKLYIQGYENCVKANLAFSKRRNHPQSAVLHHFMKSRVSTQKPTGCLSWSALTLLG